MASLIQIKIDPASTVLTVLSKLLLEGAAKTELYGMLGGAMVDNAHKRFAAEVSPDGVPWKPSIRKESKGGKTLQDTGELLSSIHSQILSDGFEYGTNVPYAPALHFGARIKATSGKYLVFKLANGSWVKTPEVNIPSRPFLGVDEKEEQGLVDIIAKFMQGATNGS